MNEVPPYLNLSLSNWLLVRLILRQHISDRKVLAFGSRATQTAKEYSDLDLAILGDEPLSIDSMSALAEDFCESDLPFKVDLVNWTRVDETIRNIIRRDGIVVQTPNEVWEKLEAIQS